MTAITYAQAQDADTFCTGRDTQGGQSCLILCPACTPPRYAIDPAANIAAELAAILHRITYVKCTANHKLDGPENHELSRAWIDLSELVRALRA